MCGIDTPREQIANNLDRRRSDLTSLRRVVLAHTEQPLEFIAVQMSIPSIYANWEGYVKEVCCIYLEYIETSVKACRDLQPPILGFLWTPILRPLSGGINFERKTRIAEYALSTLEDPVAFTHAEKLIDTKSNLNFAMLQSICESLCIDIASLSHWKHHLNTLVTLRNNIAHGARPRGLKYADFDNHASATLLLMEAFEEAVVSALKNRSFCASKRPDELFIRPTSG